MNLVSSTDREIKRKRINQYLNAKYFYSAKSRKEAVKFERKKKIEKRAYKIARLTDELNRCQEIYLNCCLNQIGSAHRLAQLIEKVEQISISDVKKSSLQESNTKLINLKKDKLKTSQDQVSSKLIEKAAFQNETYMKIEKERQLIDEEQLERSDGLSNDKNVIEKINFKNDHFKANQQCIKQNSNQSENSSDLINEFEFIYSINEQKMIQNQKFDNKKNSNEIKSDKQSIKNSKIQSSKKSITLNCSTQSSDVEDPFSVSTKEVATNQINYRRVDKQINDEQTSDKQTSNRLASDNQTSNKLNSDKQISDKKLKDKQTNVKQVNFEKENEVNLNKELKDLELTELNKKTGLKLIRSLDLSEQLFEENNLNREANLEFNYSDYLSKISSEVHADHNLNDFNLNSNLDSNLDSSLDSNLNFNSNLDYKQIGRDVIKHKSNKMLVQFNEDRIKQFNNETKSQIVTNQDYSASLKESKKHKESCEKFQINHQIKFLNHEKFNQNETSKRYFTDYLDENLSIKTPSLGSLNESINFDLTYDLPDLLITPTLSSLLSFPSINSLSTWSSDEKIIEKCANCSNKLVEDETIYKNKKCKKIEEVKKNEKRTEIKKDTKKYAKDSSKLKFNFETFWTDILKDSSNDKLTHLNRLKKHLTKFKKTINH